MAEVVLLAAAEEEYEAALGWYFDRSEKAATGFEAAVERAVAFLAAFPEGCPYCDDRHRYCPLKRYPYGLIYRVEDDQVRVVAVAHDRQLPGFWLGRE